MPAMTEPDKSFGALWQAQRTIANTDKKRAAWDAEDASMRQPANADEAYKLRVKNKQLSLLPALMLSQINDLNIQLAKIGADPKGAKASELVDSFNDARQAEWQDKIDRQNKLTTSATDRRTEGKERRMGLGNEAYGEVCKINSTTRLTTKLQWQEAFNVYKKRSQERVMRGYGNFRRLSGM